MKNCPGLCTNRERTVPAPGKFCNLLEGTWKSLNEKYTCRLNFRSVSAMDRPRLYYIQDVKIEINLQIEDVRLKIWNRNQDSEINLEKIRNENEKYPSKSNFQKSKKTIGYQHQKSEKLKKSNDVWISSNAIIIFLMSN